MHRASLISSPFAGMIRIRFNGYDLSPLAEDTPVAGAR